MIVGRKGSICPKRDSSRARNGRHIQKWGRKGFVCPKRDNIGQEMVGVSKKGAERCPYVQKGIKRGRKGSAHPKTGQARVRVSKKGRFWARKGQRSQKQGRKWFVCPKKDDSRREGVGTSKNGAGRGSCVQKGAISGEK